MELIEQIKEFIEKYYLDSLLENVRRGKNFLHIDFSLLTKFDPKIAEDLLEDPKEMLKTMEIVIREFDLPREINKFYVRVRNLSDSQIVAIKDIRSSHLSKMVRISGAVKKKSDVRPHVTSVRFECPSCGNVINVLQLDNKLKEPTKCGCGRKGRFRELSKELIDGQGLVLEEIPEELKGGEQPKRLNVFLKDDLVSPLSDWVTNPGSKIEVSGWIVEVPIVLRSGGRSTKFDLVLEANNVTPLEEDYYNLIITKEDEAKIKEFSSKPDAREELIESLAPSIYGYDKVKEALLYQLAGGARKERSDGVVSRGDIHILLIGDPGAGKSQILKRMTRVAPKARYTSGKGLSGAGLTAAVVKDEFLGGWSLEAGALVLSNRGFCMIDELDKMSKDDRSGLHEALEQQTISISKANIQATLKAETTVLAAANPKYGRFDPYDILAKQIDLPPTLINRFDLIFPIKDIPNTEHDKKVAEHILGLHQNPKGIKPKLDTDFIKKYITYARLRIHPKITDSAIKEIEKYYLTMRNQSSGEGSIRNVPITARQLEALVRLAEASAKLRLSARVTKNDARRGIELLQYCLNQVAKDSETGEIDIDRISSGISSSSRNKIVKVKGIINNLELENKIIPVERIIEEGVKEGLEEDEIDDVLEKLRRGGDIFEPKRGFISKI